MARNSPTLRALEQLGVQAPYSLKKAVRHRHNNDGKNERQDRAVVAVVPSENTYSQPQEGRTMDQQSNAATVVNPSNPSVEPAAPARTVVEIPAPTIAVEAKSEEVVNADGGRTVDVHLHMTQGEPEPMRVEFVAITQPPDRTVWQSLRREALQTAKVAMGVFIGGGALLLVNGIANRRGGTTEASLPTTDAS